MLLPVLLLPSCGMLGHATKPIPTNGCEWVTPILVSKQDVLTDGTAKQVLTLDKNWAANCNAGKPLSRAGSQP